MEETPEAHARKSVQMHLLAKHFADQLKQSLKSKNYAGDVFAYNKISFGTIVNTKEVITIEQFVDGEFFKYINNDGSINFDYKEDARLMVETLSHFSYVKSQQNLLLVDIQGLGWRLYDPEIATVGSSFDGEELLFCMGNLSTEALKTFFEQHVCS